MDNLDLYLLARCTRPEPVPWGVPLVAVLS